MGSSALPQQHGTQQVSADVRGHGHPLPLHSGPRWQGAVQECTRCSSSRPGGSQLPLGGGRRAQVGGGGGAVRCQCLACVCWHVCAGMESWQCRPGMNRACKQHVCPADEACAQQHAVTKLAVAATSDRATSRRSTYGPLQQRAAQCTMPCCTLPAVSLSLSCIQ